MSNVQGPPTREATLVYLPPQLAELLALVVPQPTEAQELGQGSSTDEQPVEEAVLAPKMAADNWSMRVLLVPHSVKGSRFGFADLAHVYDATGAFRDLMDDRAAWHARHPPAGIAPTKKPRGSAVYPFSDAGSTYGGSRPDDGVLPNRATRLRQVDYIDTPSGPPDPGELFDRLCVEAPNEWFVVTRQNVEQLIRLFESFVSKQYPEITNQDVFLDRDFRIRSTGVPTLEVAPPLNLGNQSGLI